MLSTPNKKPEIIPLLSAITSVNINPIIPNNTIKFLASELSFVEDFKNGINTNVRAPDETKFIIKSGIINAVITISDSRVVP